MRIVFQKKDPAIFAGLIRLWTRSPYSHCELLFSDGIMFSSHIADKGTRFIGPALLRPEWWDVLQVPTTAEQEDNLINWCRGELHCAYDWKGIIYSQVIKWQREHPEKWFCSELCAAAMQQIGLLNGAKPCTFSPGKLYKRLREAGASICAAY